MKFLWIDVLPAGTRERISSALQLFTALERHGVLAPQKLDNLREGLENIPRKDLVVKLDEFVSESNQDVPQGTQS